MDENRGMVGALERARAAFDHGDWIQAHADFSAAEPRGAADLERFAVVAYLVGREHDSFRAWERAYHACNDDADGDGAVRCAFWLSLLLLLHGECAHAGGWLARAQRLADRDCPGRGYVLVPAFLDALTGGALERADDLACEIVTIGRRFSDPDLEALGLLGRGQTAIAAGEVARGVRLLDEVMVGVVAGGVSPIPTGIVYCAVIESCIDAFDLRRAAEWTDALHRWCTAQPGLVPYRGQCLVHRSQVLQARGAWDEAVREAHRARLQLSDPVHPALGMALYQQGELHRLRGEHAEAERAYRAAARHGREPAPGHALLRLAEGKIEAAVASVRRMLQETGGPATRCAVRAAAVEILLAAGDVTGAGAVADELGRDADAVGAELLRATADAASGSVLLARGDAASALTAFRAASTRWRRLQMPYDEAVARVGIARACEALADPDGAALELDAARSTFVRLGARPDLARVDLLLRPCPGRTVLTGRECEVLRLVAAGRTNREIADELVISVHTVARHLQNIFAKTGLSSRAAATAYAYEHDLV
jgi:DNA-binding NarL/FixJ family response regulator